jgi:hypothetical protein
MSPWPKEVDREAQSYKIDLQYWFAWQNNGHYFPRMKIKPFRGVGTVETKRTNQKLRWI